MNLNKKIGDFDAIKITGNIKVVTGLHIGAGKESAKIGGIDNPVIKDEHGWPYIPGSSLKGKLRSLLELKYTKGKLVEFSEKDPCSKESLIAYTFGTSGKDRKTPIVVIFRDAKMINPNPSDDLEYDDVYEIKNEVKIDRISSKTTGGLRTIERVKPGVTFEVEIIVKNFDRFADVSDEIKDKNKWPKTKDVLQLLYEAFEELENDYLGGSGTRGYGKVNCEGIKKSIKNEKNKLSEGCENNDNEIS